MSMVSRPSEADWTGRSAQLLKGLSQLAVRKKCGGRRTFVLSNGEQYCSSVLGRLLLVQEQSMWCSSPTPEGDCTTRSCGLVTPTISEVQAYEVLWNAPRRYLPLCRARAAIWSPCSNVNTPLSGSVSSYRDRCSSTAIQYACQVR